MPGKYGEPGGGKGLKTGAGADAIDKTLHGLGTVDERAPKKVPNKNPIHMKRSTSRGKKKKIMFQTNIYMYVY